MSEPVIRETIVNEELLIKAEEMADNFPEVTGNFQYDIEHYRMNSKLLNELLYQRNLASDPEEVDTSNYMSGETCLVVKLNPRVEDVLNRLIKLQSDYLDKILGKY